VTRRAALLLAVLLAGACVTPEPPTRFTPAWEPFVPSGESWISTRKALLISDCQIHNLLSLPLPERNLSAEAAAATAIRPPQLDLFSPDVLAWILENGEPDADVVLHLGDALDLACTGEFDRFLATMRHARKPWFMCPGNHDFFYLGTYPPQDEELWKAASYDAGEPLQKDRFVRLYVAMLVQRDEAGCKALAEALGVAPDADAGAIADALPAQFEWKAPEGTGGLLHRIAWSLDAERPWRSFLLQAIDLTRPGETRFHNYAFLADSCQFGIRPELVPNGWKSWPLALNCGFTGEMLPDQMRTIRAWLDDRPKPSGTTVFCHHPFDHIAPRARASLGWLWREYRLGGLITAHTHHGYFQHHDLGGPTDQLELNLGSTTDWPMEWRSLQVWIEPDRHEVYVKVPRHTLVDALREAGGFFLTGWEVPPGAPDDYRRYRQGEAASSLMFQFAFAHHISPYWLPQPKVRPNLAAQRTESQVKDTLLWTYDRLVREFPTDPAREAPWPEGCTDDAQVRTCIASAAGEGVPIEGKIALLARLDAFERGRGTVDPATGEPNDDVRERFKISQAAWSARYESQRGRRLSVEDELIRVAWRPPAGEEESAAPEPER